MILAFLCISLQILESALVIIYIFNSLSMLPRLLTLLTQPPVYWHYSHAPKVCVYEVYLNESWNKGFLVHPWKSLQSSRKRVDLSVCDLVA